MMYSNVETEIKSLLGLFVFYSMFFAYEIIDIKKIFDDKANIKYFEINNIMLIIVPVSIYLAIKTDFKLIKFTYLIVCVPFILHFIYIFHVINLKFLHITNCIISFAILVLLTKCIVLVSRTCKHK